MKILMNAIIASSLSVDVIPTDNNLRSGLVAYWKLDEASGSALDAHSNFDLSDTNGDIGQDSTNKIINSARIATTQTANSCLKRPGDDSEFTPGAFTICGWARATSSNDGLNHQIITKDSGSGNNSFAYIIATNGNRIWKISPNGFNGSVVETTNGSAVVNTWFFFAVGHDGATTMFHSVNGGTKLTGTVNPPFDGTAPLSIFNEAESGSTQVFLGQIDEVGFWNRELSDSEIDLVYNSGNGKPYSEFGIQS